MREATGKEVEAALYEGDFNPRLPCGRRLVGFIIKSFGNEFQSPPPMREATCAVLEVPQ